MKLSPRKLVAIGIASAALVVGGGAAIAASGDGGNDEVKAAAQHLAAKDDRQSALAEKLGVTVEQLEAAHLNAATARIDAAAAAGDITAEEAASLREALEDGHMVKRLALTADVAEELGVTEEQLETAKTELRKEEAKARVDQAVADGQITQEYADELKQRIDEADFSERGGFGKGGPGRGHHGPGGFGGGFGPGFGPLAADSGSGEAA